jgi:hypothetical protein
MPVLSEADQDIVPVSHPQLVTILDDRDRPKRDQSPGALLLRQKQGFTEAGGGALTTEEADRDVIGVRAEEVTVHHKLYF